MSDDYRKSHHEDPAIDQQAAKDLFKEIGKLDPDAEVLIESILEVKRYTPGVISMGADAPLYGGMRPDSDGAWLSRIEVAKRLRAVLSSKGDKAMTPVDGCETCGGSGKINQMEGGGWPGQAMHEVTCPDCSASPALPSTKGHWSDDKTYEEAPALPSQVVGAYTGDELVAKLRSVTEEDAYARPWTFGQTCIQAAEAIVSLTAEGEALTQRVSGDDRRKRMFRRNVRLRLDAEARAQAAEASLASAREDALEEAIAAAEGCQITVPLTPGAADGASMASTQIADAIRALKEVR